MVGGSLRPRYSWNIAESGIKHQKFKIQIQINVLYNL